jgi:hypothetical protein
MDWNLDRSVKLCHGKGDGVKSACWMTAISMYAGKAASWKDQPECVADTILRMCIALNDNMPDDATRAKYIGSVLFLPIGTGPETPEQAQERAYIAADFAVRVFAPLALEARGKADAARELRALPRIVDKETTLAGRDAARKHASANASANAAAAAADTVWPEAIRMVEAMCAVGRTERLKIDADRAARVCAALST